MSAPAFRWSDAEVRRALGDRGKALLGGQPLPASPAGDASPRYRRVLTDSRALGPGDLFVALAGPRFDGHDFAGAAVSAGCGAIVASRALDVPVPVYLVPDTLTALGDLALHRRRHAAISVAGITGSSGKTTVKDFLLGALASVPGVHGTEANHNNRIGVPLTLLSMPKETSVLVLEMGTNEPGEIAELARIAQPDNGVVTTVSEAHIEKLGDLEGVMSEKLALIESLGTGAAVVGDEPPELAERAREMHANTLVAGWSDRADPELRPRSARRRDDATWSFQWRGHPVSLRAPGAHNVYNALLALAVSRLLGVPEADAAKGISAAAPAAMRNEVRRMGSLTVLVDCYNANAAGVAAALATLEDMEPAGRRVAVLGTMLELGERSCAIHRAVLESALAGGIDRFVLSGAFACAGRHFADDRVELVEEADELAGRLPDLLAPGDAVLLKASRGVRMERAIPALESSFGEAGI